eukprot:8708410-Pyramimonas_sp.AAC.1
MALRGDVLYVASHATGAIHALHKTSGAAIQVRQLARRENIPTRPASDWLTVRIYPRVLRPIGSS